MVSNNNSTAVKQDDAPNETAAAAETSSTASSSNDADVSTSPHLFGKLSISAHSVIGNTGRALGSFLPTSAAIAAMTQQKYTLPDKTVASQVLMYRQLLHTKCRPGLRLSRAYQATPAQKAVLHMPWWEQGIEVSQKMVISYDNLIVRLWMNGGIMPFADLLGGDVDTMINENGLPPVPHPHWVKRLGFQQPDPVTDFRSGGVLSLAMMVHMVESCLPTVKRFFEPDGDVAVLPFGITCINVTDMMAKFLMLAKSTDRMEALMSQKPFWRMFADPNAILALQEISMTMLCDVVVEMNRERRIPTQKGTKNTSHPDMPGGGSGGDNGEDSFRAVTVFDFTEIMERTERRVKDDLLGVGPTTVDELRSIDRRLRLKYQQQLEAKEKRGAAGGSGAPDVSAMAGSAVAGASSMAAGMFEKIKTTKIAAPNFSKPTFSKPTFSNLLARKPKPAPATAAAASPTIVDIPPPASAPATTTPSKPAPIEDLLSMTSLRPVPAASGITAPTTPAVDEGSWHGVSREDVPFASPAVSQFSIDDDDDDDL